MKQTEYGNLEKYREKIGNIDPKKILLVRGKDSFEKSGAREKFSGLLDKAASFSDFSSNPKFEDVMKGIDVYHRIRPNFIIAIGGGSVIDMAKLIKGLANTRNPKYCIENSFNVDIGERFIAVPTTSGSGSESTPFAVCYLNGIKYSVEDNSLLPREIVLDPELTYSLSARQTAISGMDALAQGIESYWSVNSTNKSKAYSRRAIKLALDNLEEAVNNPNPKNRKNMMLASNFAGRAIAIAKTTACHAVSYPLTARLGIPHGHAVALTLPGVIVRNLHVSRYDCNDPRGIIYVTNIMKELEEAGVSYKKIGSIMKNIGLERKPSQLGIDKEKIDEIIKDIFVNPHRMRNNPVNFCEDYVRYLFYE